MKEVGQLRWGDFKPRLAEAMVAHLAPIRTNYAELMKARFIDAAAINLHFTSAFVLLPLPVPSCPHDV